MQKSHNSEGTFRGYPLPHPVIFRELRELKIAHIRSKYDYYASEGLIKTLQNLENNLENFSAMWNTLKAWEKKRIFSKASNDLKISIRARLRYNLK